MIKKNVMYQDNYKHFLIICKNIHSKIHSYEKTIFGQNKCNSCLKQWCQFIVYCLHSFGKEPK